VRSVDQQGRSGILLSAKAGDLEMVQVLLDAGANPSDMDASGCSPLHYAASRGSGEMVRLLLENRANHELRDDWGDAPLFWAAGAPVVRLLLEARSSLELRNESGRTSLMSMADRGDTAAIEALVRGSPKLEFDAVDSQGFSAHALALAQGHVAAAELLVKVGATAASGATPAPAAVPGHIALCRAAQQGDEVCCGEVLLAGGVDVDKPSGGETPLLAAAGRGAFRIVELLLLAGADANLAEPFLHETPLMRAVLGRADGAVLLLLLESRADPTLRDLNGRTAADIASAWKQEANTEILRAAIAGELPTLGA